MNKEHTLGGSEWGFIIARCVEMNTMLAHTEMIKQGFVRLIAKEKGANRMDIKKSKANLFLDFINNTAGFMKKKKTQGGAGEMGTEFAVIVERISGLHLVGQGNIAPKVVTMNQ